MKSMNVLVYYEDTVDDLMLAVDIRRVLQYHKIPVPPIEMCFERESSEAPTADQYEKGAC